MITIDEFIRQSGSSISAGEATGRSRRAEAAIAREAYWLLLKIRYGLGPRRIGRIAGRSKETVYSGLRTAQNLLDTAHPLISPYRPLLESVEKAETPSPSPESPKPPMSPAAPITF
jgi:DNA-binding CsgD family transcriptional regulator